jgi:hypothetical protein
MRTSSTIYKKPFSEMRRLANPETTFHCQWKKYAELGRDEKS